MPEKGKRSGHRCPWGSEANLILEAYISPKPQWILQDFCLTHIEKIVKNNIKKFQNIQ
jgi:hypothetical protein